MRLRCIKNNRAAHHSKIPLPLTKRCFDLRQEVDCGGDKREGGRGGEICLFMIPPPPCSPNHAGIKQTLGTKDIEFFTLISCCGGRGGILINISSDRNHVLGQGKSAHKMWGGGF
jgi:hypothetical protein